MQFYGVKCWTHISPSGLGLPQDPQGELEDVSGVKKHVWAALPSMLWDKWYWIDWLIL